MSVCKMTLILSRVVGGCWKRHEMTDVWVWRGWLCAVVPNTLWPTERVSGKSAQSITNTQTFVHENLNQYFSAPEEKKKIIQTDKNTPANLPQSANTVVKLTGLPDLLYTLNTTCPASSCYEWAKTCRVCTQSQTWYHRYLITVRLKKKN